MEQEKYYHPQIEDIRIGYEFEEYRLDDYIGWYPITVTENNWGYNWESIIGKDISESRVPYLTKDQIEKEGWIPLSEISMFTRKPYKWEKRLEDGFNHWKIYTLEFEENIMIQIHLREETSWENQSKYIFSGKCPSINEFRLIQKLLNIQ